MNLAFVTNFVKIRQNLSRRVRVEINLHFQKSRRPHGKARGGQIAGYLTDAQRSQAEWIGALKCEVVFERPLSTSSAFLLFFFDSQLINTVTYRPKADTEQFGGFLLFPLANFKGLVNMYSFDVRQDIIQGNTIFHLVQVNI